jgi:hypothetical protein
MVLSIRKYGTFNHPKERIHVRESPAPAHKLKNNKNLQIIGKRHAVFAEIGKSSHPVDVRSKGMINSTLI